MAYKRKAQAEEISDYQPPTAKAKALRGSIAKALLASKEETIDVDESSTPQLRPARNYAAAASVLRAAVQQQKATQDPPMKPVIRPAATVVAASMDQFDEAEQSEPEQLLDEETLQTQELSEEHEAEQSEPEQLLDEETLQTLELSEEHEVWSQAAQAYERVKTSKQYLSSAQIQPKAALSKSTAVERFRKAKEAGEDFSAGWRRQQNEATDRGFMQSVEAKSPAKDLSFQRVFLESQPSISKADIIAMNALRAEWEISVEVLGQMDVFPPISSFQDLGNALPDYAYQALHEMGIQAPMPIQAQALPILLAGLDVIGIAKTGSGKTLAYLLPALTHIEAQEPVNSWTATPIALVLAPTRELAVQIADEAKKLVKVSIRGSTHPGGLGAGVLYGGGNASKGWQVAEVKKKGHIVAATPGRLIDVMTDGEVSLERVTYFVLDEADRMLECGFADQVGTISQAIRGDRQTLFFSATWPVEVQNLARNMCQSGVALAQVMVGQRTEGDGPASREDIVQEVVVFDQNTWEERDAAKQELLYAHLREVLAVASHKVLVFVSRKNLADELSKRLWKEGFKTNVMHGGKAQETRLNIIEEFRRDQIKLLVTTDVMGRGLDIPGISHVVIFDMGDIDSYVHRIGRTARGPYGKGHALTFFEFNKKHADIARQLVDVLRQSEQEVPEDLLALAVGKGRGKGW